MTKLSKIYETKPDPYGFRNQIEVDVDYNPDDNSIDNMIVWFYSYRYRAHSNITDLFETVPELISLVDNINWEEIYIDYMTEKGVHHD